MIFTETSLKGAFVVEIQPLEDERGLFARTWCEQEFLEHGLNPVIKQCNISFNRRRGTLRGMHFQVAPHGEAKLVRCTRGAIHDVIIDLRPDSATWRQSFAIRLAEQNHTMLYIPEGFAHGFQTLEDNSEVFYQMSAHYEPSAARGVRWNDPAFGIRWPAVEERIISDRDARLPDFSEEILRP
ncbi:MAG TPA: dTDP-4-dehydrorhamnose 3,5-epimerase [Gammaproteobacteria bacterium]|nr:dTDP-4-dehydrorhamnose 3,5-epimerase [Gammaproteobacteria bacterium]